MSNIILGKVWKLKLGDPTRKLVAACLADAANHEGTCWPSLKGIADLCEVSEQSCRRHIKTMEESGLISKESRYTKGRQTSNGYTFNMATLSPMIASHPRQGEGVTHDRGEGVTHDTLILEPSDRTSNEPPEGAFLFDSPTPSKPPKLSKEDKAVAATIRAAQAAELLDAYPKPSAVRHIAERLIATKLRKHDFAMMLAAVKEYAKAKAGTEARFVKTPENWFRDDCFLIAPQAPGAKVPGVGKIARTVYQSPAERRRND